MRYQVVAQSDALRKGCIDWSNFVDEMEELEFPLTNRQKTILNKRLIREQIDEIDTRIPCRCRLSHLTGEIFAKDPHTIVDIDKIIEESISSVRERADDIKTEMFGDNIQLSACAEILGVNVSAAESALRYAGIRTGYPLHLVRRLRDSRR